MLQHFGVIPFLIFDGDYLPSKAATEADRAKRREESKRAGMELLNAGKTSQAHLEFQKAVDVTPEMARQLIDELKETGVQYIVAPYEADAQMVYLERKGIIQGILSEDSDLLVFGAKCLLTKLDQYGNCIEINKADFCACKEITLTGWSDKEFRQMAILSGCDYLNSISNMGLKTAYRMVRKHKTVEKVLRMLQFDGKFHVPKGYLEAFYQAELTFLHQWVYCPRKRTLVFHTEPEQPIDEGKMPFIGAFVEPEIARGVATGDLNPMTKQPIVVKGPQRKNRMVTSTPLSSRSQHYRSVSSADLKKGVSIERFFGAKRTPLAELDINCFTPSPSQQEALNRNSGPWDAIPVPRPYLNRSTSQPEQVPQSAPPPARIPPTRTHLRTPTISEPRPPKRARLCADDDMGTSPTKLPELTRSKFWAASTSDPSPSAGRAAKSRRAKKADINIFSDDSVEEAMRSLPDADGFKNMGKSQKMQIFQESNLSLEESQGAPPATESQSSVAEEPMVQDSTPSLTAGESVASSAEQPPTPPQMPSSPTSIDRLKDKFTFGASSLSTPTSTVVGGALPTPSSFAARPSKIPLAVKTGTSASKSSPFSTMPRLTPLQRLGASGINRSRAPMTPPQTPTYTPTHIPGARNTAQRRSLLSKGSVPFPEVATERQKSPVSPAAIPLPPADETENKALAPQNGSEDMMVPDSEEDEPLSPGPEGVSASKIDFAQFVYAR